MDHTVVCLLKLLIVCENLEDTDLGSLYFDVFDVACAKVLLMNKIF